jgi:hypothetical protein
MAVMVRATPPMKPASPASCATSTGATRAATEAPRCCTGCWRAAELCLWVFFWRREREVEGAIECERCSSSRPERRTLSNRAHSPRPFMPNAPRRAGRAIERGERGGALEGARERSKLQREGERRAERREKTLSHAKRPRSLVLSLLVHPTTEQNGGAKDHSPRVGWRAEEQR